jgi:hypothetical protein
MTTKGDSILRNQRGAAMLIALVMMIVLTLIGLASTYTSTFEMKTSGNKRGATNAFYVADAAAQAAVSNVANFDESNFTAVPVDDLPDDIKPDHLDKNEDPRDGQKNSSPSLPLPSGVSFTSAPSMNIYQVPWTNAPRGLGFSATGSIEYKHFIINSAGTDQIGGSSVKGSSQVREKVVRLIPTSQGGI